MIPPVLIIEFREGFTAILKQVAQSKGALVESLISLDHLGKKFIPDHIEQNFYKLIIINYKMAKEYQPFDVLAFVKKNNIPFALLYTDSLRAEKEYEAVALWSFVVTDNMKDDSVLLFRELNEAFVMPPQGMLKYAL